MNINELIDKFGIGVTYLNPCSLTPNDHKSKMGGHETYIIDEIYKCKYCGEQMSLILEDSNYAQVKTCYNESCTDSEIEFHLAYGNSTNLKQNKIDSKTYLPCYYICPTKSIEIPYNTYETDDMLDYINKVDLNEYEELIYNHTARIGTKLNGDIFSWHKAEIPTCNCGKKKNQILQISSYEPNLEINETRPYYEWDSSIGIIIGECGNYHFFVCKACGLHTLESNYDSR
jgi:hypothetical protein